MKIKYCIICARAGSKGLKNKNILKLSNKLLLEHTLDQALKSKIFDRVIITTNIIKVLSKFKNSKNISLVKRKKSLSSDKSEKIFSIRDAVLKNEWTFFII